MYERAPDGAVTGGEIAGEVGRTQEASGFDEAVVGPAIEGIKSADIVDVHVVLPPAAAILPAATSIPQVGTALRPRARAVDFHLAARSLLLLPCRQLLFGHGPGKCVGRTMLV
jgi:hypothetical protein